MSDDQKALLRLLAGGQGYEDIAALLGTSVDEVKAKAGAAVEQLEAEGIPAPSLPGAPARSAADPEPPSDPPPPPAPPPTPAAPEAPLKPAPADPEPPSDPPPSTRLQDRSARPQPSRPKLTLPSDPGKRAAIAAGAIVVALIVIVLIVSGSGSGGSDPGTAATTTSAEETGEAQTAAGGGEESGKVTKAVLTSIGGGEASGVAIFGRVKKSLALQIQASGLEPTSKTDSYTVWLAQSPQKMLPLASTAVKADGRLGAQFEVPVEVLAYLASETFDQIVVTKTDDAKLQTALKQATKAEQVPTYTGEAVLFGEITGPIIGAEKRIEEAKEAAKEKKE